jgi:hypothetical protein
MTNPNIKEINQKIAIFMGAKLLRTEEAEMPHGSYASVTLEYWQRPKGLPGICDDYADMGHFKYDRSWDWLMPVLAKIVDAGYRYEIGRNDNGAHCSIWRNEEEIVCARESGAILSVWQAASDFIDIYNLSKL